ncbi:competence lipoprotein ComL, putative [Oceanobacter sp. RED65]|uniref:Outer membrane protein assembly factor BamD n=2 Tax=Bermanella marisrubri TaxID=207949 RepID=Q1N003_9GAMM|nr:competence lipoprotein ComL, putative [Oceanobacter sp. RED65] [Bermanella marisrubri]
MWLNAPLISNIEIISDTIMRFLILLITIASLAACSSSGKRPDQELSERGIYDKAMEAIGNENFFLAIETLERLENRYPFGKYSEQAQLEMIHAQYQAQDLENARATAERFIRLHPQHPKVDYAYYMKALTTYELGLSLVERYFADEESQRDPSPAQESFNELAELIKRFPNSEYAADARQRMIYLRDRIALHEIHVARYYLKRHAYVAAANRGRNVVENFQGTKQVDDGLAMMVEAYTLLGQKDLADKSLKVLKANYPEHEQLVDGKFQLSGWHKKDHRSIWNVMTFGLVD